jgi:hypothetical protein
MAGNIVKIERNLFGQKALREELCVNLSDLNTNSLLGEENLLFLQDLFSSSGNKVKLTKLSGRPQEESMTVEIKKIAVYPRDSNGSIVSTLSDNSIYQNEVSKAEKKGTKFYEIVMIDSQRPEYSKTAQLAFDKLAVLEEQFAKVQEEIEGSNYDDSSYKELSRKSMNLHAEIGKAKEALASLGEDKWGGVPTVKLIFSEDGSFAEVAAIESQSSNLSGSTLMNTINQIFSFVGVESAYLHDASSVLAPQGEGQYSLRTFRYMTADSKKSWYEDSFQYKQYRKEGSKIVNISDTEDSSKDVITPFKERSLSLSLEDCKRLKVSGGKVREKIITLLSKYQDLEGITKMSDLVKYLGAQIKKGGETEVLKVLHRDLRAVLEDYTSMYIEYSGSDPDLVELKDKAESYKGFERDAFYRRDFSH